MPKVKPYIITVRYLGVYEDPRPTVDQIANELNIDPLDILIEEATVTPKIKSQPPVVDELIKEVAPPPAASTKPTKADKIRRNMLPFDTTDLDSNGPSVKILAALHAKPLTQRELRDITGLNTPTTATTLTRLKHKGRVKVEGRHPSDGSIYVFVK